MKNINKIFFKKISRFFTNSLFLLQNYGFAVFFKIRCLNLMTFLAHYKKERCPEIYDESELAFVEQRLDHNLLNGLDLHYVERFVNTLLKNEIEPCFLIFMEESLGDVVAMEPVPRFLKENWPNAKVLWIVDEKYSRVLSYNPFVDYVAKVKSLSDGAIVFQNLLKKRNFVPVNLHFNGRFCNNGLCIKNPANPLLSTENYFYYGSLLESFSMAAGLPKLNSAPVFYIGQGIVLPPFLPEKYIVFHCMTKEYVKNWPKSKWNVLAKNLFELGFYVVEIGYRPVVKTTNNLYIDFTGERDLQIIAKVISQASFFIGLDSGFSHIANCFSIPALLIFGRYFNFVNYNVFTGSYLNSALCRILRNYNRGCQSMPVKYVLEEFQQTNFYKDFIFAEKSH